MDLTPEQLVDELRDQVEFLRASGASYDSGFEGEAKRLALAIRILVHDASGTSHSLLGQLEVKDRMLWTDTSMRPPPGVTMMSHGALCGAMTDGTGWRYAPLLDHLPGERINPPAPFRKWWTQSLGVAPVGAALTRERFVKGIANKRGAHVDPKLDSAFLKLVDEGLWGSGTKFSTPEDELGDLGLCNVRQIAWETLTTIEREIGYLLDPALLAPDKPLPELLARHAERNDRCPCGSGRKFKHYHGR